MRLGQEDAAVFVPPLEDDVELDDVEEDDVEDEESEEDDDESAFLVVDSPVEAAGFSGLTLPARESLR